MSQILSGLKDLVTPYVVSKIADQLGVNEMVANKAVDGLLPSLLNGVAGKADDPNAMSGLLYLIQNSGESGVLNNLGGLLNRGGNDGLASSLLSMVFGNKAGSFVERISDFSGLGGGATKSLIGMVSPVVLEYLSKLVSSKGLNATGLADLFKDEKLSLIDSVPLGLGLGAITGAFGGDEEDEIKRKLEEELSKETEENAAIEKTIEEIKVETPEVAAIPSVTEEVEQVIEEVGIEAPEVPEIGEISTDITSDIGEKAENVVEKTEGVVEATTEKVGGVIEDAKDSVLETGKDIKENVSDAIDGVGDRVSGTIEETKDKLGGLVGGVSDKVSDIKDNAVEGVSDTIEGIGDSASDVIGNAKDTIGEVGGAIGDKASDVFGSAKETIGDVGGAIGDRASDIYEGVGDRVSNTVEGVRDTASGVYDTARDSVSGAVDTVGEGVSNTYGKVRDRVSGGYNGYNDRDGFSLAFLKWLIPLLLVAALGWYFLKGRGGDFLDTIRGTTTEAVESVGDAVEDGVEATKDGVEAVGESVKEGVDAAGNAIEGLGDFFKRALPNGVELDIPKFGIENKMVDFIEDSSLEIDNKKWFNFDRLVFETGSTNLNMEKSGEQLKNIAAILNAYPNTKIKIGGYTDNTGSEELNLRISQLRAETVKAALIEKGIATDRLEAKGYGEAHPVATNTTEDGRAKNRRIALLFTGK